MNNKGDKKNFILICFILIGSVICLFLLLKNLNNKVDSESSTIRTIPLEEVVDNNEENNQTINDSSAESVTEEEKINVVPFEKPLEEVVNGYPFDGKFKYNIMYSGTRFEFECIKVEKEECVSSTAKMDLGNVVINLPTFNKAEISLTDYLQDNYLIVTDDFVLLASDKKGDIVGEIKKYDRNGKQLDILKGSILSYLFENEVIKGMAPSVSNNVLYYYHCNDAAIEVNGVDFNDFSKQVYNEPIPGVSCR